MSASGSENKKESGNKKNDMASSLVPPKAVCFLFN